MTRPDFFPDLVFGWSFYCVLVVYLIAASIVDFRKRRVPKTLTLSCLAVGLLFNIARGTWLGSQDKVVWLLPAGPVSGLFDGLLFGVLGFGAAFAVFLLLWIVRAAGGGDLKLFSAVGAWVGPVWMVWLMALSVALIAVIWIGIVIVRILTSGLAATRQSISHAGSQRAARKGKIQPTYSFSLLLATAMLLPVVFRQDLGIAPKPVDAGAVENKGADLGAGQAKR